MLEAIFNPENAVFRMINKLLDLMVLSLVWVVCCIPVVTAGAASSALYYAVVKRRGDMFRSPMAFGRAVQDALDETTYANCLDRLRLLRVDQLPGGFVGLTMTLGSW